MDSVECIVAGGGVIGLSVARALALSGREVLLIERRGDVGLETSGRNSEVIHAGIYYPEGSLKARLCRTGREKLVDYLGERGLPHRICGKLIVATSPEQHSKLLAIGARARANGVHTLRHVDKAAIAALEPELTAYAGLFSPQTGIFDSRAFLLSLKADLIEAGGTVACHSNVAVVERDGSGFIVTTEDAAGKRFALRSRQFVNAAGHGAPSLARSCPGTMTLPQPRYARGTYYRATGRVPFSHLVYPVPEPGGLGIHLTLDMAGGMRFGPDVEWIEAMDTLISDHRRTDFRSAIAAYWPEIVHRTLEPDFAGVRPKIVGPGEADADFLIAGPETHGLEGLVHLMGIESPGLTASLAIAEHVAALI